jgi:putative ABC transport system permease protein
LRTVGFTARQSAGLLAWELGPTLVVGLVAGILVGLALPVIVLTPIDLSGFTGGPVKPAIVIDPVLVTVAAAGFAVITALATLIALTGARRRSPATVLRAGGTE